MILKVIIDMRRAVNLLFLFVVELNFFRLETCEMNPKFLCNE